MHMLLRDCKQFEVEDELRVWWNVRRRSLAAVSVMRWNGDSSFAANRHASDTDVPTLDHFAGAEFESERFPFFVCCL